MVTTQMRTKTNHVKMAKDQVATFLAVLFDANNNCDANYNYCFLSAFCCVTCYFMIWPSTEQILEI
jgi:hypothetical protein